MGKEAGQRIAAGVFTYAFPTKKDQKAHNKEAERLLEYKKANIVYELSFQRLSNIFNGQTAKRKSFVKNMPYQQLYFCKCFCKRRHLSTGGIRHTFCQIPPSGSNYTLTKTIEITCALSIRTYLPSMHLFENIPACLWNLKVGSMSIQ